MYKIGDTIKFTPNTISIWKGRIIEGTIGFVAEPYGCNVWCIIDGKKEYITCVFGRDTIYKVGKQLLFPFMLEQGVTMAIKKCKCKHEYQDNEYGKGLRVHNESKSRVQGRKAWTCTVCGTKKDE